MDTASQRDETRLFQTRDRAEEVALGERIPPVHGMACGRASHHIGRDRLGPTPQLTAAARGR